MLPHIRSKNNWNVVVDGKSYSFNDSHLQYNVLTKAVMEGNKKVFLDSITAQGIVKIWSNKTFKLVGEGLYFVKGNRKVEPVLEKYAIEMIKEGLDSTAILKFISNLYLNPSKNSVEQLFKFLQHGNFPLTEDGCFLGYKAVTKDFKDKHTGKICNKIGKVVKMPRNEVSDNTNDPCDQGLHVGTYGHAKGFRRDGDVIVIVKVNPRDVVSVPKHDTTKLRCCEYKVIEMCEGPMEEIVKG